MDENENLETMNGTIIFQDVNIGSKKRVQKTVFVCEPG